jgi:hypothetical protein
MIKIYICDDQAQAATVILKEGQEKLINTGANPTPDCLVIRRDSSGTEVPIGNFTGQSKHVLVFKI